MQLLATFRRIKAHTFFDVVPVPSSAVVAVEQTSSQFIQQAIKRPGALTAKAQAAGGITRDGHISIRWAQSVARNPATDPLTRRQASFFLNVLHPIHVRRAAAAAALAAK